MYESVIVYVVLMILCVALAVRTQAIFVPLIASQCLLLTVFNPADGGILMRELWWQFLFFDLVVLIFFALIYGIWPNSRKRIPTFLRILVVTIPFLSIIGRVLILSAGL